MFFPDSLTIEVSETDGTAISTSGCEPLALGDALHRVMEIVDLAAPQLEAIEPGDAHVVLVLFRVGPEGACRWE